MGQSLETLFIEKDETEQTLADIYVTVKHENEASEKERNTLSEAIDSASAELQSISYHFFMVRI